MEFTGTEYESLVLEDSNYICIYIPPNFVQPFCPPPSGWSPVDSLKLKPNCHSRKVVVYLDGKSVSCLSPVPEKHATATKSSTRRFKVISCKMLTMMLML